jgi:hypothetical protein
VIQQAYDFVKSKQLQIPRQNHGTINASKATIRFSMDSRSDAGNVGGTFHWQRDKYAGQVPLLYNHIICLLIMILFQEFAVQAESATNEHVLN